RARRGRRGRGRAGGHARDVRHLVGGEPQLPDPVARVPRHAVRDRLPRGRAFAPAAVRQHRHRAPRAGRRPDRRRAGQAADGGVRQGRAGARRAVIAHTVAAPVVGRRVVAPYGEDGGFVVVVVGPRGPLLPNGVRVTGAVSAGPVAIEGAHVWDPALTLAAPIEIEPDATLVERDLAA